MNLLNSLRRLGSTLGHTPSSSGARNNTPSNAGAATDASSSAAIEAGVSAGHRGLAHAARRVARAAAMFQSSRGEADSFYNPRSGIGTGRDRATANAVSPPVIIDQATALDLWRGSHLVRRALGKRASVALSRGVELTVDDGDADWLEGELGRLGALERLREGRWWGNLYGGALVVANCDGGGRPEEPLEPETLRQVVNLRVVDRWQVSRIEYAHPGATTAGLPTSTSMLSRDGQPEVYVLQGGVTGTPMRYHASRVWRFDGALLPWDALRANGGWHDSLLVGLWHALSRRGIGLGALATQLHDSTVGVWKIAGFHDMLAGDSGELDDWLESQVLFRSVLGDYALDAEAEGFEFKTRPMRDAVEVFEQLLYDLAAEADLPFTELYGRSPAGMNATGEGDRIKWHETINASERPIFEAALSWLLPMLQAQTHTPQPLRDVPVAVGWPSLEATTAAQDEERRRLRADEAARYVEMLAVSPIEVRRRLRQDHTWELDASDAVATSGDPRQERGPREGRDQREDQRQDNRQGEADAAARWQVGAVALDGAEGDGAKLAVMMPVSAEVARLLPGERPHITVAYLPQTQGRAQEVAAIARRVIGEHGQPFRASLGPVCSMLSPEGQLVFYQEAHFDWHVWELRDALVAAFVAAGLAVGFAQDWRPHLTLAIEDDPRATWVGQAVAASWWVDAFELWGSPQVEPLPLETASDLTA